MGRWQRWKEWWTEPNYRELANKRIKSVRQTTQAHHGTNPDIVRPLEAERLKSDIRAYADQGGKHAYKHALALWQISKALYGEWISDADKPTFVPEYWKMAD